LAQVAALATLAIVLLPAPPAAASTPGGANGLEDGPISTPVSAGPAAASNTPTVLCKDYEHEAVTNYRGAYVIRNDNFAHEAECLQVERGPGFTVVTSGATHNLGNGTAAFPNVFKGWSWGVGSANSGLPKRVSALRNPETNFYTSHKGVKGQWSTAYDIWFGTKPMTTGQANGTEIMLWLNTRDFSSDAGIWPVYKIDGRKWYLERWRTRGHAVNWNYMQFRLVHQANSVVRLKLAPFLAVAERLGKLKKSWYMENIEAGFEIWSGGKGLRSSYFWAQT
jgi:cellulose 1,4-beta-cellobiosidase